MSAPRSMSRNIDAVNGEFGAVSIVRVRSTNAGRGAKPSLAAIAAHLAKGIAARSAAPAATMSPIVARIRQVIPALAAMNTYFSHISCRIALLGRASKQAPENSLPIVSMRVEADLSSSPKVSV